MADSKEKEKSAARAPEKTGEASNAAKEKAGQTSHPDDAGTRQTAQKIDAETAADAAQGADTPEEDGAAHKDGTAPGDETAGATGVAGTAEQEQQEQKTADGAKDEGSGDAGSAEDGKNAGAAEAAKGEDEALQTKYLRLMADFQNFKRRTEKEKSDIYAYGNEKIVSELLGVMDNFERALEHGTPDDAFTQGMQMIFKQLGGVLEKAGVAEIEALGKDFDPNFHNAVMTEASEAYESGKVSEVLQKGYTLNGRLIRPAMVKVAS